MRTVSPRVRSIVSPRNKYFIFSLGLLGSFFASCNQPMRSPESPAAEILFPSDGASFEQGQMISFISDREVLWESSRDGSIGQGKRVVRSLSQGTHEVTIHFDGTELDKIRIRVAPIHLSDMYRLDVQGEAPSIRLPDGSYRPFVLGRWNGAQSSFHLRRSVKSEPREYNRIHKSLIRDRFDPALWSSSIEGLREIPIGMRSLSKYSQGRIGDARQFRMPNISGGGSGYDTIDAVLVYIGKRLDIWSHGGTATEIESIGAVLDEYVLPRHSAVWGGWKDIDDDGKIAIISTRGLNDSGKAVGF